MRILAIVFIAALALPLGAAEPTAKKPAKGKNAAAKEGKKAPVPTVYDIVRIWDKDGNRQIEGAEAEPLRAAVAEATEGVIKSLDTDNDGKLGDAELAAMNAALKPGAAANGGGEKKGGKPASQPLGFAP